MATTAHPNRHQLRRDLAGVLDKARAHADLTQEDLSHAVGRARHQDGGEWCHRNATRSLYAQEVPLLPRPVALAFMRWAADLLGLDVVERMDAGIGAGGHHAHLARIVRETSEVGAEYAVALADGHIDPVERIRIARETREAIYALTSLLRYLEAEESGVRGHG